MLVLGIVLILVALVAAGFLIFGTWGQDPLTVDFGVLQASLTPLQIFLLGALCLVLLALGLASAAAGMRKQTAQRREVRQLRDQVDDRGGRRSPARDRDAMRATDRDQGSEPDRAASTTTSAQGSGSAATTGGSSTARRTEGDRQAETPNTGRDGTSGTGAGDGSGPAIDPKSFRP